MSLMRPEFRAGLARWSEVLWAAAMLAFGLWVAHLGGLVLIPAGLALAALGLGWGVTALRRMRFVRETGAPGVIEVDEAQIGYLGPNFGGYVSVEDLVELRLLTLHGRRLWRLKQADGQALLVPVDATGSERLYDAFARLPGIDMGAVVAALNAPGEQNAAGPSTALTLAQESRLLWHRSGTGSGAAGETGTGTGAGMTPTPPH